MFARVPKPKIIEKVVSVPAGCKCTFSQQLLVHPANTAAATSKSKPDHPSATRSTRPPLLKGQRHDDKGNSISANTSASNTTKAKGNPETSKLDTDASTSSTRGSTPADVECAKRHENLNRPVAAKASKEKATKENIATVQKPKEPAEKEKASTLSNVTKHPRPKSSTAGSDSTKQAQKDKAVQKPKHASKNPKASDLKTRQDSKLKKSSISFTTKKPPKKRFRASELYFPTPKASPPKKPTHSFAVSKPTTSHSATAKQTSPTTGLEYHTIRRTLGNPDLNDIKGRVSRISTPQKDVVRLHCGTDYSNMYSNYLLLDQKTTTPAHAFTFRTNEGSKFLPGTIDELKYGQYATLGRAEYAYLRITDTATGKEETVHAVELGFSRASKILGHGYVYGEDPGVPVGEGRFINADATAFSLPAEFRRTSSGNSEASKKRTRVEEDDDEWEVTFQKPQKRAREDTPVDASAATSSSGGKGKKRAREEEDTTSKPQKRMRGDTPAEARAVTSGAEEILRAPTPLFVPSSPIRPLKRKRIVEDDEDGEPPAKR